MTVAIAIAGSAITIERVMEERRKEIILKIEQKRFRAITLQEAMEKRPIWLLQYWKN